jgi:hypothetical protein
MRLRAGREQLGIFPMVFSPYFVIIIKKCREGSIGRRRGNGDAAAFAGHQYRIDARAFRVAGRRVA